MTVTVNGVAVDMASPPGPRVAAVRELLRQRAVAIGLLSGSVHDGRELHDALEQLLAREVQVPAPTETECRRHYEMHLQDFRSGEIVCGRHILFQVTPSVPIPRIRDRAERTLAEVLQHPDRFAVLARELSNCPSGQQGGNLGQLRRGDTVPEFEQAIFRPAPIGVLRELIKTRHGFHIVAVDRRIPGETLPYELVCEQIAHRLQACVQERALRQYVSFLAGQSEIQGVDLAAAPTPLVQ